MTTLQQGFEAALACEPSLISYRLAALMHERHRGGHVLVAGYLPDTVQRFAGSGACVVHADGDVRPLQRTQYDYETRVFSQQPVHALHTITFEGARLELFEAEFAGTNAGESIYLIGGPDRAIVERFYAALYDFANRVEEEVMVFDQGCWSRDPALHKSIAGTTLEGLVLDPELKNALVSDLESFFGARELYKSLGVPWKRGVLLLGPPGNGKTHAIKALVNHLRKPCLYVKSFESNGHRHQGVGDVFERARQVKGSILVLEDLDALVTDANRSYFLNELDGFAANDGMCVIATTNHPEQLDVAIVERPSRFDRKYHFVLPASRERRAYVSRWFAQRGAVAQPSAECVERVASQTDGYSFAYLKELCMSALMAWANTGGGDAAALDAAVLAQCKQLRTQMSSRSVRGLMPPARD